MPNCHDWLDFGAWFKTRLNAPTCEDEAHPSDTDDWYTNADGDGQMVCEVSVEEGCSAHCTDDASNEESSALKKKKKQGEIDRFEWASVCRPTTYPDWSELYPYGAYQAVTVSDPITTE